MNFDIDSAQTQAQQLATSYGPKVIAAVVILLLGWLTARFISAGIRRVLTRAKLDHSLIGFSSSLARTGVLAFVIIAALEELGVETTSFAAIIAAVGLAIGFALQSSLGNLAAGVMLLVFRPFKTGDYVEAGGTAGTIKEILIFSTLIETPDNKQVTVPNGLITGANITNYSANATRRVDMVFGIGYGDDIKKAKDLLGEIVTEHPKVLDAPEPVIAVSELADSSVNFVVRPWVKTEDYWSVYFELQETVKLRFDNAGISIPFPQQDIHLHQ